MPDIHEPSLPRLSPSEEFALAHPDFIQPTVNDREWDPNARRAESLKGSGGGFAAAIAGEITSSNDLTVTPVHITKPVPVTVNKSSYRKRPLSESRRGDSERDTGEPHYYGEPQLPTEEEKSLGRAAIQAMRDSGVLRTRDNKPK